MDKCVGEILARTNTQLARTRFLHVQVVRTRIPLHEQQLRMQTRTLVRTNVHCNQNLYVQTPGSTYKVTIHETLARTRNLLYEQNSKMVLNFHLSVFIPIACNMILPRKAHSASKRRLSQAEVCSILVLRDAAIEVKKIMELTGVSQSTIYRLLKHSTQPPQTSFPASKKPVGRPRKTTEEMDKFILDTVNSNRKLVPRQIQKMLEEKFGINLSCSRIRLRLQLDGLNGSVCVRKPLLKRINKIKRLLWAFKHRSWSVEQWMRVLWSDEKKFEVFNSKRRTTCRRRKGEQLRDDTIQATVKHGGGSAMFWGCFGGLHVGDLFQVKGIMKKEEYHSILVRHAIPSGKRLFGSAWVFQQDNDPKHTSKLCQNYLKQKAESGEIVQMEWPPQSPDLSPIELLWEEVDRQVQRKKPSSVESLVRIVHQVWGELSEDVMEKLLKRMPLLCQAVIDADGGYFDEKLSAQKKKQLVYH